MEFSTRYMLGFTTAVCAVCSIFVSGAAVSLKERQEQNKVLERQQKVLSVAGLLKEGQSLSRQETLDLFKEKIVSKLVDVSTGEYSSEVDAATYDQRTATKDPALSTVAPENNAGIARIPKLAKVYQVVEGGEIKQIILPIEGKGLWSTLYGYLALDIDTTTVLGLTFYEHAETPGLGGEIDNPRWKALWKDRKAFDENWNVKLSVIKGTAGPPESDPHRVDGLSGATLTGRGVNNLIHFWLDENGFGPYLAKFRENRS